MVGGKALELFDDDINVLCLFSSASIPAAAIPIRDVQYALSSRSVSMAAYPASGCSCLKAHASPNLQPSRVLSCLHGTNFFSSGVIPFPLPLGFDFAFALGVSLAFALAIVFYSWL